MACGGGGVGGGAGCGGWGGRGGGWGVGVVCGVVGSGEYCGMFAAVVAR